MKSIGAGKRFENMQKYNKQGSGKVTGASVFIRHQKEIWFTTLHPKSSTGDNGKQGNVY